MIYAMSDIHGCIEELQKQMEQVDLSGKNRIIFLGDYIDYGDSSCQVLEYIRDLQKEYGEEKVVVLKGNHEQMFLEWIDDYRNLYSDGTEDYMTFNDWLRTDFEYGANTIRTFVSDQKMDFLNQISRTCSMETINREAVQMILSKHEKLIWWIQQMSNTPERISWVRFILTAPTVFKATDNAWRFSPYCTVAFISDGNSPLRLSPCSIQIGISSV